MYRFTKFLDCYPPNTIDASPSMCVSSYLKTIKWAIFDCWFDLEVWSANIIETMWSRRRVKTRRRLGVALLIFSPYLDFHHRPPSGNGNSLLFSSPSFYPSLPLNLFELSRRHKTTKFLEAYRGAYSSLHWSAKWKLSPLKLAHKNFWAVPENQSSPSM